MTVVVETTGLGVRIGSKALLDDVTLSVAAGEVLALVGPNGAGKSTLLRMLAGEIGGSAGAVRLKGRDPRGYHPRMLALHRAVLSQSIAVAFPFSVAEVVRMGAGERRGPAVDSLVGDALAQVDLDGFGDRILNTLSGGEQQRAHFARVLVQVACGHTAVGPGLLLLDEPTASLDLRHQLDIVTATRRCVDQGTTVIAILHDLNLAALLANRIVVLADGRIAADGPPSRTITDEVLRSVFGVACAVDRIPESAAPFVLPHGARKHSGPFPPPRAGA
jgi:iron complex transport system ATP-binding protein